jgi:hypothetical protein
MSKKQPITISIERSDGPYQIVSKITEALGEKRTAQLAHLLANYPVVYKRHQRERREARERERARERIEGIGRVSRIKGKVEGTVIDGDVGKV